MGGFLEHLTFGIFVLAVVAALYEFVFGVRRTLGERENDE